MSKDLKEIRKAISYLAEIILSSSAFGGMCLSSTDRTVLSNLKEGKFINFTGETND